MWALTLDLQTDCDVHGPCYIHRSADICPSILWGSSFNVQTAITPQKHLPSQLNLCRGKMTTVTQKQIVFMNFSLFERSLSYRFAIVGPVSFWKRYSIQQHARNTQGLADAGSDDRSTVCQERGLCRRRKCKVKNTLEEQETGKVF